jgi:hypothetical protein
MGGAAPDRDASDGNLFDLAEDPGETANVWGDPCYGDARAELVDRLCAWASTTDWDPRLLGPERVELLGLNDKESFPGLTV